MFIQFIVWGGDDLIFGLIYGYIYLNMRGTYVWASIVPHETLQASSFRKGIPITITMKKKQILNCVTWMNQTTQKMSYLETVVNSSYMEVFWR